MTLKGLDRGSVTAQLSLLRRELDEQRQLLMDTIRQMLMISQVQAENTRELTKALNAIVSIPQMPGGGSSRVRDDETELKEWRAERDAQMAADRPDRTIGAGLTDPANDW